MFEILIIAAAVACIIGWHASQAQMSQRGIPVRRAQLRGYRRDRVRYGLRMIVVAVILTVILVVIAMH